MVHNCHSVKKINKLFYSILFYSILENKSVLRGIDTSGGIDSAMELIPQDELIPPWN
jgi:hypothetical protein